MQHRRVRIAYLPAGSVAVREDELLAREWGCKPGSAHQRKLRLPGDLATVIQVRQLLGAHESLAAYLAPVESAQAATPQPDAIHREAMTDPQEDVLQELYRADPCEQTARALIRFRAVMRQACLDADREIAARWGLTL